MQKSKNVWLGREYFSGTDSKNILGLAIYILLIKMLLFSKIIKIQKSTELENFFRTNFHFKTC